MTIKGMIDDGIIIQGIVKIQEWIDDTPTVYYEGNAELLYDCKRDEILERQITYMFPYVGSELGICIEIDSE